MASTSARTWTPRTRWRLRKKTDMARIGYWCARARTHARTHARMHAAHMSLQVQAKEEVVHIDGGKITSKRKESEECEDLRQAEETPRDMIVPGGF